MISWILSIGCLIGTFLNCKKIRICFIIWLFCNIGWLILDIDQENYGRALLDFVQFLTAIWGFIEWGKK